MAEFDFGEDDANIVQTDGSAIVSFERGDHVELAAAALTKLGPAPLTHDAGEFWRYSADRGVWELIAGPVFRMTVANFAGIPVAAGKSWKPLKVNAGALEGTESIASDVLRSNPSRVTFKDAVRGVAFRNGFVRVENGNIVLAAHSPEHRARHGFDLDYAPWNPAATPLLCALLAEIFGDCAEDERANRIALLQEFVGACLCGDAVRYQKCMFFHGSGSNGKSTILNIIRAMFPPDARACLAPQRWSERFALECLDGKLVNLVSETPTGELLDGAAFKAVVTGDEVDVERKQKDRFKIFPVAGHIFSTNWPLGTADHSEGFWRRPIVLPFTRNFENDPSRRIEPEKAVIAGELAGVLAFCLEGAARAQRNGKLTVPDQSIALANAWRDNSDSIRTFLATRPDVDNVRASEFFDAYKSWSKDTNHGTMSSTKFALRVAETKLYAHRRDRLGAVYERVVPALLARLVEPDPYED